MAIYQNNKKRDEICLKIKERKTEQMRIFADDDVYRIEENDYTCVYSAFCIHTNNLYLPQNIPNRL